MTAAASPYRHLAAAVCGNALEFYDFTAYAFFAVEIGHSFFPAKTPFESLMLTLFTFGAGFVTRPLGAIVIGALGDRAGRRPAMLLSFGLMGAAAAGLALTPSYAKIGPLAALLVVFIRLVQGFALGGEVGPVTAFLVETAPTDRRGAFGAWQIASQGLATLVAGLVGLALSSALNADDLQAWGWRLAFLLGASILPIGVVLRWTLPETLHATEAAAPAVTEKGSKSGRIIVLGLGLILSSTTAIYVLNYMNTYAVTILHMTSSLGFATTAVTGVCGLVFAILGGVLSDRVGRRPMMIWPAAALFIVAYPLFALMDARRDAAALLVGAGVMAALLALSSGVRLVSLAEGLPRAGRSAGVAIVYASMVAVFGGAAQPALAWLLHVSAQPTAAAWFIMATTLPGLAAAILMPETRPDPGRAVGLDAVA